MREALAKSSDVYVLEFEKFHEFLTKSHGSSNIVELAIEYTQDTRGLIQMIEFAYPLLNDKSLKAKCTRIKKKLLKHESSEGESDYSQIDDSN